MSLHPPHFVRFATSSFLLPRVVIAPLLTGCAERPAEGDGDAEIASEEHELDPTVAQLFEPIPEEAPAPEDNPMTEAGVELGHMLFFEQKLSRSGTVSCNTCHVVGAAGVDHLAIAVGDSGRLGTRASPTVYNAAFLGSQFWNRLAYLVLVVHREDEDSAWRGPADAFGDAADEHALDAV